MRQIRHTPIIWAYIIAVLCTVWITTGCSSHDYIVSRNNDTYEKDFKILSESLVAYSNSFEPTQTSTTRSKKWWSRLWNAVKADYLGYTDRNGVRHECMCVGSSIERWNQIIYEENVKVAADLMKFSPLQLKQLENQIAGLKETYYKDPNNLGALHNACILKIMMDCPLIIPPDTDMTGPIIKSLNELGVDTSDVCNKALKNEIDIFIQEMYDDDISVIIGRLKVIHPQRSHLYDILELYFNNVVTFDDIDNIDEYTEGFLIKIDRSPIPLNDIQLLHRYISIVPASLKIWIQVAGLYHISL